MSTQDALLDDFHELTQMSVDQFNAIWSDLEFQMNLDPDWDPDEPYDWSKEPLPHSWGPGTEAYEAWQRVLTQRYQELYGGDEPFWWG